MTDRPGSRPQPAPSHIVIVNKRSKAPPAAPGRVVVVLDMAWTPGEGERPDVLPIRPIVERIVERRNLFVETLDRLDAWAEAAGAAEAFTVDGATWWFHARGFLRLIVHELLLWRAIINEVSGGGTPTSIVVPGERQWLVHAARAGTPAGTRVRISGLSPEVRRNLVRGYRLTRGAIRTVVRAALVTWGRRRRRQMEAITRRLQAVAQGPTVLAVLRQQSFHVIGRAGGVARNDPYVGPVLDRLAGEGIGSIQVVLGMTIDEVDESEPSRSDGAAIVPVSYLADRFPGVDVSGISKASLRSRLRRMPPAPMVVDGADLGPAVREEVVRQANWLSEQARTSRLARELVAAERPAALLTGWEAARTSWLVAARRERVPIVAIQHGVIYPRTPDYVRPPDPRHVVADVTCTFGSYERDLLLDEGGYAPESVVVTGSPRAAPDSASASLGPEERAAVRKRLGVADGDRLLVVSTARHSVGDEFHGMAMAGRVLGGPLPGIHIVFKLHPEEQDGSHYLGLVRGIAAAGGYQAPAMSVIRDIDIYRLLRAADAHLGQYSTVLTDAVLTGTPNMIAVGHAWSDIIGYVAAGVATPVRTVDDVRAFLADPQPPPAESRARFLDAHSLAGDATERVVHLVRERIGR
jgi:hypothetical protein